MRLLRRGDDQDAFSVGDMKKSGTLVLQYCYVWSPCEPTAEAALNIAMIAMSRARNAYMTNG